MVSPATPAQAVDLDDVHAARAALQGVTHRTPVLRSRRLDELVGAQLLLKAEHLQRTGSFKLRGAYNQLSRIAAEARRRGVVTGSSGNHAQALALAGALLDVPVTVLMPHDASPLKVAATAGYGADVVRYDRFADDRDERLRILAGETGRIPVHAFDEPGVIAGQGTVALELIDQADIDMLVCCVGGGGLISGCAIAAKSTAPSIEVVGVQPAANAAAYRSWLARERVTLPVTASIADGQQVSSPGMHTLAIMLEHVDRMVTVSEAEIAASVRLLCTTLKAVVEPSGASALAAILSGAIDVGGRRVGVTLSGGNVDPHRYAQVLGGPS